MSLRRSKRIAAAGKNCRGSGEAEAADPSGMARGGLRQLACSEAASPDLAAGRRSAKRVDGPEQAAAAAIAS